MARGGQFTWRLTGLTEKYQALFFHIDRLGAPPGALWLRGEVFPELIYRATRGRTAYEWRARAKGPLHLMMP